MRAMFLVLALMLAAASAARANTNADCDQNKDQELSIRACTLIIDGKAKGSKAAAYSNRANAYSAKGDTGRAITDLNEAIRLDPKNATAYGNRAWVLFRTGKIGAAKDDAEKAFSLKKDDDILSIKGRIKFALGDADAALSDFNEALRLNESSVFALSWRGQIYEKQGKTALAIADYRKALEGKASDPDYREAQAAARDRLAALEEAAKSAQASPSASVAPPSAPAVPQALGRRVALVIGNSAYDAVQTLPNARKDAAAIAARLETLGFDVTVRYDLAIDEMRKTFAAFEAKADGADWALVYYAGHGIELDGENWLVPKDSRLAHDSDVADETFSLKRVLDRINGAHFRMVLLDACRNNPFLNRMKMAMAKRAVDRGLGRIEPARGEVVFYAARAGTVASDGDGENGPFAAALLAHMSDGGLELGRFLRKVTTTVERLTNNEQEPFVYGTIPDADLYLKPLP